MRGVQQHNADHVLRVLVGVNANEQTAERVADEHVGRGFARIPEQTAQLAGNVQGVARLWARLAPPQPRAVIRADAGIDSNLWLHTTPERRHGQGAGFEHHSGAARACALNVQPVAAHIHQLARGREVAAVGLSGEGLVGHPYEGEGDRRRHRPDGPALLATAASASSSAIGVSA